jgi:hypothetical protein
VNESSARAAGAGDGEEESESADHAGSMTVNACIGPGATKKSRATTPMIRALIFDFDGLILDTETALIDAYGDVHGAHGVPSTGRSSPGASGMPTMPSTRGSGSGLGRPATPGARGQEFNRARNSAQPILPGVVALIDEAKKAGLARSASPRIRSTPTSRGTWAGWASSALRLSSPAARTSGPRSPSRTSTGWSWTTSASGPRGHSLRGFAHGNAGGQAGRASGSWPSRTSRPATTTSGTRTCASASLADCGLADLMARFGHEPLPRAALQRAGRRHLGDGH